MAQKSTFKSITVSLWLLALCAPGFAQFGSGTAKQVVTTSTTLPATCNDNPMQVYGYIGSSAGLYYCYPANTWNQVGSGSGSGTVTSVSVTTANGVSGTVANPTTTPAISLTLGAITPSSVTAVSGLTSTSDGVHAGILSLDGNTTNPVIPANTFGWLGFDSTSATAYYLQPSTTAPASNFLQCAAPVSGVSACTWASAVTSVTFDSTGTGLAAPVGSGVFTYPASTTVNFSLTGTAPASTSSGTGTASGNIETLTAAAGGATTGTSTTGGAGGGWSITAGAGGSGSGGTNASGGAGGSITLTPGGGGAKSGTGTVGATGAVIVGAGSLQLPAGAHATPSLNEGNNGGLFFPTANLIELVAGGNDGLRQNGGTVEVPSGMPIGWDSSSNYSGSIDTALSRDSAGVVDLGDGTAKDKSGTLQVANLNVGTAVSVTGAAGGSYVKADGTGSGTPSGTITCDPAAINCYIMTDPMCGGSTGSNTIGQQNWSVSGSSTVTRIPGTWPFCMYQVVPGTTSGNAAFIWLGGGNSAQMLGAVGSNVNWTVRQVFTYTKSSNTNSFRCGFVDAASIGNTGAPSFGMGLLYVNGTDTNWQFYTAASSSYTKSDTTIAEDDGVLHGLQMSSTSAGTVVFSLLGATGSVLKTTTISSGIPTSQMTWACGAVNAQSAANIPTFQMGYFQYVVTGLSLP